ncbi:MAG: Na(+)-translocating NADH-quinone reductase subunit A [Chlamydiales bacterium]|nr:Na(+)-translocating NADH-quinone reductase subunit A [Chlamydiales bacterium]
MKIIVKKGLDIPIEGKPEGSAQNLALPRQIALNLDPFDTTRFKLLVKGGETVKIGQPLVESKTVPGQMYVSPAGGVVNEVRRGFKRRLIDIVIDVATDEEFIDYGTHSNASPEEILNLFMRAGVFPHVRVRPFDLIADPAHTPRAIFVHAVESLPFVPSAEMQVEGHEGYFQAGLDALTKLTSGKVHLVYREGSFSTAFTEAKSVEQHTVAGPHPAATPSLHIHKVAPITSPSDCVWTLSTIDVITAGKMVAEGRYFTDRIVGIGGSGVVEGRTGFFRARAGFPISALIADRITSQTACFVSGDPLTGTRAEQSDFIGFYHTAFSVIPENTQRQLFHFLRPGLNKYSATGAYFTGHVKPPNKGYFFSTNQHGEERAFIDGAVYEKVMPLGIPTMHLVKAILAQDFETAEQLGLLEVTGDDFALASFICPSKIEMIQAVKEGLHLYAKEMGH